jgi:cytochrome c oxidase cbb3-type subunit IV
MLKFIKHHLETITGIEVYPVVSFIVFTTFFLFMLIWVFKTKSAFFEKQQNLPLE